MLSKLFINAASAPDSGSENGLTPTYCSLHGLDDPPTAARIRITK